MRAGLEWLETTEHLDDTQKEIPAFAGMTLWF